MLTPLARATRALSLGIWLGAGVMTFITASYVFGGLPREKAGDIMGAILHTAGWLKVGLAVLALGSEIHLRKVDSTPGRARLLRFYALIIATIFALVVTLYLEPKMVDLRAKFMATPNVQSPEKVLFGQLHGASMGLALCELIFVALALVCAVV